MTDFNWNYGAQKLKYTNDQNCPDTFGHILYDKIQQATGAMKESVASIQISVIQNNVLCLSASVLLIHLKSIIMS